MEDTTIGKNKTQNYFLFFVAANENRHKLSLSKLIAKKYKWIAKTKFNCKTYKKFGIFILQIALEKIETAANHLVLKQVPE